MIGQYVQDWVIDRKFDASQMLSLNIKATEWFSVLYGKTCICMSNCMRNHDHTISSKTEEKILGEGEVKPPNVM